MSENELQALKARLLALEDAFVLLLRMMHGVDSPDDVIGIFFRNLDLQVARRFPGNLPDVLPGKAKERAAYANALKEIKDSFGAH